MNQTNFYKKTLLSLSAKNIALAAKAGFINAVTFVVITALVFQSFIFNTKVVSAAGANVTVSKLVMNNNGGTAVAGDFLISIKDSFSVDVAGSPFAASTAGTTINLPAGTYTISETGPLGYSAIGGGFFCSDAPGSSPSFVIVDGVDVNCSTVSDDQPGNLTIAVNVDNTGYVGAPLTPANVNIAVSGPSSIASYAGTASSSFVVDAGSYTVTPTITTPGFSAVFASDCSAGGVVAVAVGQSKTCTLNVSYSDNGNLIVQKVVNGSTASASAFTIYVANDVFFTSNPGSSIGTNYSLDASDYTVFELPAAGFTTTYSGDCNASGVVTVVTATTKTCVVTNTALEADLTVTSSVNNASPSTGNNVVYTFTVTNNGPQEAQSAVLNTTIPAGLTFVSSSSGVGSYNSATGVWSIGNIANGASQTIQLTYSVNSGSAGLAINYPATTSSASVDSNTLNNSTSAGINVQSTPTISSFGGGGGGGSSSGGGSAIPTPTPTPTPAPAVAPTPTPSPSGLVEGAFTNVPSAPAVPQVLGAATTLPRTGLPVSTIGFALISALAFVSYKKSVFVK